MASMACRGVSPPASLSMHTEGATRGSVERGVEKLSGDVEEAYLGMQKVCGGCALSDQVTVMIKVQ